MRIQGQQVRTWQQFESQLPNWKIEPVSIGATENNTEVKGIDVFYSLVKLSGIDRTPEEIYSDLGLEEFKNSEWEWRFWDKSNRELLDWFWLCERFLTRHYHRRWAYVKSWNKEMYGQVNVSSRHFHMKTPEGVLEMPATFIADQISGENKYVFFPMKALLSDWEQAMFELYRNSRVSNNEIATLEQQIMMLLEKLAIAQKEQPQTIVETNWQFAEIEQMCKDSWVITKLSVNDWRLALDFGWRKVMDTDWEMNGMILPPFALLIDLRNYTVRGSAQRHPHIMSDNSLCMGWRLTDLAHKCVVDRDLKTLVGAMIDFGNSWTSSDAGESDRHPAECIINYVNHNQVDWNNVPVDLDDIVRTLNDRWYGVGECGNLADFI